MSAAKLGNEGSEASEGRERMAIPSRYENGLANGTPVLGAFCCLDGFSVSQILARAGFDFLVLDRRLRRVWRRHRRKRLKELGRQACFGLCLVIR